MLPYRYSAAVEAHLTGRPILAALVLDYQDDPGTYDKDFHFMLGRWILVAPVMEKTDQWEVYLPKGKWIHYWTGKQYQGGQTVTVDAPLNGKDGLPMFVKTGAIIPMMPEMSYIYEKTPEPITLDVYPDAAEPSNYVMYDCDTPKASPIKETSFMCLESRSKIAVSIDNSNAAYELWVHCDKQPASVSVDSKMLAKLAGKDEYDSAAEGWYFGPGSFYGSEQVKTVNIKVPKGSGARVIRIAK
jgi:alpha-glucosidase (family GH31 glycosyl hydrolase)